MDGRYEATLKQGSHAADNCPDETPQYARPVLIIRVDSLFKTDLYEEQNGAEAVETEAQVDPDVPVEGSGQIPDFLTQG